MTPEEFNANCMQYVNKHRQDGPAIRPEQYRIPPEIVELINVVGPKIIKSFAYSLNINLYETSVYNNTRFVIPGFYYLNSLNGLDWVWFMSGGESFGMDFYLNCNPDSPHYGSVICMDVSRIYYTLYEFITNIQLWVQDASDESWEQRDARAQTFLDRTYRMLLVNPATNRMVLTDPTILPYSEVTRNAIVREIEDDINDEILGLNIHDDFPTSMSFVAWLEARYGKN